MVELIAFLRMRFPLMGIDVLITLKMFNLLQQMQLLKVKKVQSDF